MLRKLVLMAACLAAVARADQDEELKREIRHLASDIQALVDRSEASTAELESARRKLEEVKAALDGGGDGGDGDLYCKPYGSGYAHVARASDDRALGREVATATCQAILRAARHGVVCAPYDYTGNYAYVTVVATARNLGREIPLSACLDITRDTRANLTCSGYDYNTYAYVTRLPDGATMGREIPFALCGEILRRATRTMFCKPYDYSGSYAYVARIADGQELGREVPYPDCFGSITP